MPCKTLLALPLLGACVLSLLASLSPTARSSPALPATLVASSPQRVDVPTPPPAPNAGPANAVPEPPAPEACQPWTHTMTIYNGDQVQQQTFIWRHGSWRSCGDADYSRACFRDGPCSAGRCYGTYRFPRRAQKPACCSAGASCHRIPARHHCT